jgi:transposase
LFASVIVLNYQDLAGYAKKFGYLPTDSEHFMIKQRRIKFHVGRYYLTCLVEQADLVNPELIGDPIGIDLGLKRFAILMIVLCIIIRTKAVK